MTEARRQWLKDNADKVREYKRRSAAKAYDSNPHKFSLKQKAWRSKNNGLARRRDAAYRRKYAQQRKAYFDAWRRQHREYFKARHNSDIAGLADWYVRAKLSRQTSVKPSEWPASLVELKRAQLKVKRLCHNPETSKN